MQTMSAWDDHEEYYYSHILPREIERWTRQQKKVKRDMSKKRDTVYLTGKIYWAKIFGDPRTNYNEDGKEWAFEFEPDAASEKELRGRGLGDRIKDGRKKDGTFRAGYDTRAPFINLKRNELDYQSKPNENIRVVDAANQTWPEKTLLGNGSIVDVKVNIVDYGAGKFDGIYPQAIRVLELVPYESEDFAPLPDDDPRKQKAKSLAPDFKADFGLEGTPEPEQAIVPTEEDLNDEVPL